MRVVIHIGTNKTGTSALQRHLAGSPESLRNENLIYPLFGRRSPDSPAHHALAEEMQKFPHRAPYSVAALEEEAANENADGVFLFSEVFHTFNPIPFIQTLQESGHEVEAVCVLRNHIDYFSSWYRETVKSEVSCFDFPNFVYLVNKPYMPFLSLWLSAVGEDNLHVYKYEEDKFHSGSNPLPLFDSLTSHSDMNIFKCDENFSLSGNLLFFKRILNNFIDRETTESLIPEMWELSMLKDAFRGDMFVSTEICDLVDRLYAHDTLAIEASFGIDIGSRDSYREGSLVPDLRLLAEDRKFLISESKNRGFLFGGLLQRYIGPC